MARRTLAVLPAAAALLYMLAPGIGSTHDSLVVYNVAAGATLVALWIAILVCRPLPAGPWTLIGVALACWVAGDLVFTAVGSDPTWSVADLIYIPGHLGFILAAAWFVRAHTDERDLDSMIDALLIGIAGLLFLWILVIEPTWNAPGASPTGQLTSALYPLLDVVLLFFLVRLLLSPGRTPATVVFVAAVAAVLVADSAYAALQQTDSYGDGLVRTLDGLWLLGYALLPVAVVLNRNDAPTVAEVRRGRPSRVAGLLAAGIAFVALPAADIAARSTGRPLTNAVVAVAGVSIVALVFVRIIRLQTSLDRVLAEVQHQQRYYRAVANHSSDHFVVLDADGSVLDASGALEAVLGRDAATGLSVDVLTVVHPEDRALARALFDDARSTASTVTGAVRVVTSTDSVAWMELHCTNLCDDPAVGGIVVNAHDVTARKNAEAALEHRALHDSLTGLANRALLKDRIEHALARRTRDGVDVAVLFCDLDGFKLINDGVGHEAGDEMLRIAGERFAASLRPEDTVARIGGDEFAALVEGDGNLAVEVDTIARRLLASIAEPVVVGGTPMVVTTSIGVAVASRGGQTEPDELLRDADTAMYTAKARGRNRVVAYDATMRAAVLTELQLGSDLRRAPGKA